MKKSLILVGALLCLAFPAFADISDTDFEKSIEKYLGTDKGQDALGSAVEKYFQKKQMDARKKQEQQADADLEKQFKTPVEMPIGGSPVMGPADAKITVVEFSDFQCPYCSRGRDTMKQLMEKYKGKIKLVFKNLPLEFHKNAEPAAKAALAANKQGKFWEMHDAFFDKQDALSEQFYLDTAKSLGLDLEKFKKDMADPAIAKQIEEDKALAAKNQISGTPGFFVNGVAVRGAYPVDYFSKIVDRWLAGGAAPQKG